MRTVNWYKELPSGRLSHSPIFLLHSSSHQSQAFQSLIEASLHHSFRLFTRHHVPSLVETKRPFLSPSFQLDFQVFPNRI